MASIVQRTGLITLENAEPLVMSFGSLPAVGNMIVVLITYDGNSGLVDNAVTDNQGHGAYAEAIRQFTVAAGAYIFYLQEVVTSSGTFTVSVAGASSAFWSACMLEVNGQQASALDKVAGASGTSTTPSSGATATTTQANELIVACCQVHATGGLSSLTIETTSPVWVEEYEELPFVAEPGEGDSKFVSSTGAYTANWTASDSAAWEAAIATFKVSGTGPRPRYIGI